MVLDLNICQNICTLLHTVILDSSVLLLTGILWKLSLFSILLIVVWLFSGRTRPTLSSWRCWCCNWENTTLSYSLYHPTKLCWMSFQFIQSMYVVVLWCDVDKEISDILLSRLALSLITDSLQDNGGDAQFVLQVIPLLQNVFNSTFCSCYLIL